ncbi:MAG: AAA family ATPase [Synergistota bacterium]|nr:AAA family ATPase [Synergistota bacterium]
MIKKISMKNIGPSPFMELEFGERLNLITGDNGLGKSFLLDIAWWAMTRSWPAEQNPKLRKKDVLSTY